MANADEEQELQRFDIIKVGIYKYLVYNLNKNDVDLIPIDTMLQNADPTILVPRMTTSYESLKNYEKMDRFELFCLMNQTHPLIKEALEDFLKDEEKQGRKN